MSAIYKIMTEVISRYCNKRQVSKRLGSNIYLADHNTIFSRNFEYMYEPINWNVHNDKPEQKV